DGLPGGPHRHLRDQGAPEPPAPAEGHHRRVPAAQRRLPPGGRGEGRGAPAGAGEGGAGGRPAAGEEGGAPRGGRGGEAGGVGARPRTTQNDSRRGRPRGGRVVWLLSKVRVRRVRDDASRSFSARFLRR